MTTLQITLPPQLQQSLDQKTKRIGVSKTAYVKMLIAQDMGILNEDALPGNLFNADRDNNGKGIPLEDFKKLLIS